MRVLIMLAAMIAITGGGATSSYADVLPSGFHSSTLTAYVSEQALVSMPASADFTLKGAHRMSAVVSTSIKEMAFDSASGLRIAVKADTTSSNPGKENEAEFSSETLRWNSATWNQATGHAGTLSKAVFHEVATALPNTSALSTQDLTFYHLGNMSGRRRRNVSHQVVWKVEYLGL